MEAPAADAEALGVRLAEYLIAQGADVLLSDGPDAEAGA
jgi:hypothetical protein